MSRARLVAILLCGSVGGVGCASHADFVKTHDELRALAKEQEQTKKAQDDLSQDVQARLKTLEAKVGGKGPVAGASAQSSGTASKDAEALREQVHELADRLNDLERRLAKVQDAAAYANIPHVVSPEKAAPAPGDTAGSRQSKPANVTPIPVPEAPPVLPGTPGLSPTSAFNLAYNDYLNGRYDLAVAGFERFLKDFPSTSLTANAHYWIGESHYSLKDYRKAMQAFEVVIHDYPKSEKVPPALFKLGLAAVESGDPLKARTYLKRVIEDYSSSNEAKLAKNKLAEIR